MRIAYLAEYTTLPFFGSPIVDARIWVREAQEIAAGKGFELADYFRPPLYTLFLAFFFRVFGDAAFFLVPLVQLLLGAWMCVLIYSITARCWNYAAGVIAGVLAALYSPLLYYEAELLNDSLALFLAAVFLFYWIRGVQTRKVFDFFYAGLFAGLSAVTRPNLLLVIAAFAAVAGLLALIPRGWNLRYGARATAAFAIPAAIIIAVPSIHTAILGDFNLIASQGGVNFYVGNNPKADGVTPHVEALVIEGTGDYRDAVAEFGILGYLVDEFGESEGTARYYSEGGNLPRPSTLSGYWYRQGFSYLFSNPREAVFLYLKKFIALWNDHEVRNNRDYQFLRDHFSLVLKVVPFSFGWIFPLAVVGIFMGMRDPRRQYLRWILLYTAVTAVAVLMFFVAGRLRVPIILGLFSFAAIGVEQMAFILRARRWRAFVAAAAAVLFFGFVSFYDWPQFPFRKKARTEEKLYGISASSNYAEEFAFTAFASFDAGKFESALEYARRGMKYDPELLQNYVVAGNAEIALKRYENAIRYLATALKIDPTSSIALTNIGHCFEMLGDLKSASDFFHHTVRHNAYAAPALGNLTMLYYRAGFQEKAREFAERAIAVNPEIEMAQIVLAVLEGRQEEITAEEEKRLMEELQQPISPEIVIEPPRPVSEILAGVKSIQEIQGNDLEPAP